MEILKKKITRKGAGRTKGSFSFVSISQSAMIGKIADPNFLWLVSRKQAESLGFKNLNTNRVSDLKESIRELSDETKIKIVSEEF